MHYRFRTGSFGLFPTQGRPRRENMPSLDTGNREGRVYPLNAVLCERLSSRFFLTRGAFPGKKASKLGEPYRYIVNYAPFV